MRKNPRRSVCLDFERIKKPELCFAKCTGAHFVFGFINFDLFQCMKLPFGFQPPAKKAKTSEQPDVASAMILLMGTKK